MTTLPSDSALTAAKLHAIHAWTLFTRDRNLAARVPDWRTSTAPDGSPHLSAEVAGPGAAHALHAFAADYLLILGKPGDVRPQFDYSRPGRISCVWRSGGVWVELWHPEEVAGLPAAVPSEPEAGVSRASGRFLFTRRSKKETTTA
ncbi:hypothetical protein [Streptomyces mexicanus]|uniref:hypothetical protein n=1 Tax=Streptomyces mexicanus TaxID=178566 RepID=UPI003666EF71